MPPAAVGLVWAITFVVLESIQFVFFGGLFQHVNSFLFGFCVIGLTSALFIGVAIIREPEQVRLALRQPLLLLKINVTAAFAWIAFLGSVQLIEPAIAYTIGAGVMPITAFLLHQLGWPEGEAMRNRTEGSGNILVAIAIVILAWITIAGLSGFVRNGDGTALLGVMLAVMDGVLFTMLLAFCQRLDRSGVGPGAIFGLRFPLYVFVAGILAIVTIEPSDFPEPSKLAAAVAIGFVLIVPPLYFLQRAVALISTMTLSAITASGPFVIFVLQMIEGRVAQSGVTLIGLFIYFVGALLATVGAIRATIR